MSDKNKELDNNAEKKTAYKSKKLSDEEIAEYLKGSILVPKYQWKDLYDNSNISYIKNDGGFVKSGFIKLIYNKDDEDYIRYGSKLDRYNNDKYYKEFTVKFSNIKALYKKIDNSAIMEYKLIKENIKNTLSNFTEELTRLDDKVNDMNEKIIKLDENHVKIVKLIKKLHNISSLDDLKNYSK
jgi:hypothetical protein